VALVVTTWNLQGSKGVDAGAIAAHTKARGTDVLLLQEVQQAQCRRIAHALDARSRDWAFKHTGFKTWPEGMAIIGVTRRLSVRSTALTKRFEPWNWRRRIVQVARSGDGEDLAIVNVHLTAHPGSVEDRERARELGSVAERLDGVEAALVGGDFNATPSSDIFGPLRDAGMVDTWPPARGTGPTNWAGVDHEGPANRRLDYVWATAGTEVIDARVPQPDDDGYERFGRLSDHLPLTVTLGL
jgi:endonuclease/exonuclease/phosphatase family metal-dependent hydrolase